jgi:hypothetical protein
VEVSSHKKKIADSVDREGATVDDRWKWNETIGPLEDRPGREGNLHNPKLCY